MIHCRAHTIQEEILSANSKKRGMIKNFWMENIIFIHMAAFHELDGRDRLLTTPKNVCMTDIIYDIMIKATPAQ